MKRASLLATACLASALCAGCKFGTSAPDAGNASDYDAAWQHVDAGPGPDPCLASKMNATKTVGCNGGLYGSVRRDDAIGGTCTPDGSNPMGAGSCTDAAGPMPVCAPDDAHPSTGTCVAVCPVANTYISRGGCPVGSRCFKVTADGALCLRDCHMASDCFAGEACNAEGSCVQGPPVDGGVSPDGSAPVDAGPDAGVHADGGSTTDASVPADGGSTADAGANADGGSTADAGAIDGG